MALIQINRAKRPSEIADIAIDHLKRNGRDEIAVLRVESENTSAMVYIHRSGIIALDDLAVFKRGMAVASMPLLHEPNYYDLAVVVDKKVLGEMSGTDKPRFVDALMTATAPGGLNVLHFDTLYHPLGEIVRGPRVLEFEAALMEHYRSSGWGILHYAGAVEEVVSGDWEEELAQKVNYGDVKSAYLIAQKPDASPLRAERRE